MGYPWYYNNSNGRPYNKYISYSPLLTTASLSGGWVPGMSKGFHFWQPAPRLNNAPWLAQCCNPAMSPHEQEAKTGTRHTEEQRKEKGGRGESYMVTALGHAGWQKLHALPNLRHMSEALYGCGSAKKKLTSDRGYCWCSLLLTIKLHLNT